MSEPCRSRRGEGYGACDDEKQEKAPALFRARTATSPRSAGRFQGRRRTLFRRVASLIDALSPRKAEGYRCYRIFADAIMEEGGF